MDDAADAGTEAQRQAARQLIACRRLPSAFSFQGCHGGLEPYHRLQEAGALAVRAEPTPLANDYWRCIDRALKAQASNAAAFRPLGQDTTPLSPYRRLRHRLAHLRRRLSQGSA